jgi:MYXO-CTERM domain-containing protein
MKRLAALLLALSAPAAADVSRTEVIDRAKAYVFYPWRATQANLVAACHANYTSDFVVGDFVGVAYDWGGFDSLFDFSRKLGQGQGAGSPAGGLVSSCTTGVDCSGFVSRTWKTSTKYGTSTIHEVSSQITTNSLLAGDALNDAGNHVTLFSHLLGNGQPYMYEAAGFNARINTFGGWSYVNGYIPRRFNTITGTTVGNPAGTLSNPIEITSFPFVDSRNTQTAPSSVLDGCGAALTTNETGPEYIYRVEITQPGSITVSVSDDVGADIDVHLMHSSNTNDCTARNDSTFTATVDCGTYYIVADTFGGMANAGNFDLTVTFNPNGAQCGNGPPGYDPHGQLGDACSFPGNPNLPGCNATLGAEVCLYTSGAGATSFCTAACATSTDCSGLPGGGCCEDIGSGEKYCLTNDLCATDPTDPTDPSDPNDPNDPSDPNDPNDPSNPEPNKGGGCAASSDHALGAWLLIGVVAILRRRRR